MLSSTNKSENFTKNQKGKVAILSIGTALEFFDLCLYIHMSLIISKVFFPKNSFLLDISLYTSFFFQPLGAILFGWIGDHIGRRSLIFFYRKYNRNYMYYYSFMSFIRKNRHYCILYNNIL